MQEKLANPTIMKIEETAMVQGMSGSTMRKFRCLDGANKEVVVVVVKESPERNGNEFGLTREVHFYNDLRPALTECLRMPRIFFAEADDTTGAKVILMEHFDDACIQAGYFFDPRQPNNWEKNVEEITSSSDFTPSRVLNNIFEGIANLHGRYWNSQSLRGKKYLRGNNWTEDSWNVGQNSSIDAYRRERAKTFFAQGKWSGLKRLLEASHAKISFESYKDWAASRAFTLVHGDFHPGNMLILPADTADGKRSDIDRCCFLDWEMVGVGSGSQELGQFMISHPTSVFRREHEQAAVRAYYDHLVTVMPADDASRYTFEQCWQEYVFGGLGKWLWFMPILADMLPVPVVDYFAEKVLDFCHDHGITVDNVPMPRFF